MYLCFIISVNVSHLCIKIGVYILLYFFPKMREKRMSLLLARWGNVLLAWKWKIEYYAMWKREWAGSITRVQMINDNMKNKDFYGP